MTGPAIQRRIFIVGAPRSGTTLVQTLLASHSSMTSFTESHFFDRHYRHLPLLGKSILACNPAPRVRQFLAENDEAETAAAGWFASAERRALRVRPLLPLQTLRAARCFLRLLDELAQRRGASGSIEKTPAHLRHIPLIERASGGAGGTQLVHVIRGGIQVVASLHEASKSWERPYDLVTCVERWNTDAGISSLRARASSDHFVFYEELASEPEATLRRLLSRLGLPWESDMLENYARTAGRLVTTDETWKADVGREIRPSRTAETVLTREQIDWVSGALRHDLHQQLLDTAGRRAPEMGLNA